MLFYYILLLLITISCSPSTNAVNSLPERPQMVEKVSGADLQDAEVGIDAHASKNNDIIVMWHKHPQIWDIDRFILNRYTDENDLLILDSTISISNTGFIDTVYIDKKLKINVQYFYSMVAIDKNENRSLPSDTVFYTLLEKPTQLKTIILAESNLLGIITNPQKIDFIARYFTTDPNGSLLRIREFEGKLKYLNYIAQDDADGDSEFVIIGDTLRSVFSGELNNSFSFQWRIDLTVDGENMPYIGSESAWQELNIRWE